MQAADGFRMIEQPSLDDASKLICDAWARPCWNYDTGLLKMHIMRPSGDSTLAVGQVSEEDGRLASFQAYMPFEVEYFGRRLTAVFASFLTVSIDFRRRGLAGPQQKELLQKAIDKGYDLYVTMCETGAVSNIAVENLFTKANLDLKIVNVLNYLASPRQLVTAVLPESLSPHTREYKESDQDQVSVLLSSLGGNTPLRKIIPNEDIDFLFRTRPHTRTFVYEKDGAIKGFANVLLLEVLEEDGSSNLNIYFDNVSMDQLDKAEMVQFLGDVMLKLQDEDYYLAFMPNTGYTDVDIFKKFRFRGAPRQMNLYIGCLKDAVLPDGIKEVDSFFMDVY